MFKKMLFLILLLPALGQCLKAYDPVDTVWRFHPEGSGLKYYAVSPNGKYVAVAQNNSNPSYNPKLYDAESGTFITELEGWNTEQYNGICFSPDSRYLAVSGFGNRVVVWDIDSNRIDRVFIYDSLSYITSNVLFSPTGDTIIFHNVSKSWEKTSYIVFKDFQTGENIKVLDYNYKYGVPINIYLSPDSKKLIVLPLGNFYYLKDIDSLENWKIISFNEYWITGVDFSSDGSKIVSCDSRGNVKIINSTDTSIIKSISFSPNNEDYSSCGTLIFARQDDYLILFVGNQIYPEIYGLYLFNPYDSTILRNYHIFGDDFQLSNDELYLYFSDSFYIYKIALDWIQSIFYKEDTDAEYIIRPNPVNGNGTLRLDKLNAERTGISLHDSEGRLIKKLYEGIPGADTLELDFNTSGLSKGAYYCTVSTGSSKKVIKVIVE